jgi:hypothetical protein
MRILASIVICCALSGCVTSAEAPSFASAPVPEARSDVAVLYVFRGYAQPTALASHLDIDDKPAASLLNQGFTWLYLKPGTHKFKHYWNLLSGMPTVEFSKALEGGQTYVFQMRGEVLIARADSLSTTAILEMELEEAKEHMASCCRYVPSRAKN